MNKTLLALALVSIGLAAHAQTAVKIGYAGPLTGPISHIGKDGENGARLAIEDAGLDVWIQVDGGVSRETIERAAEAGANNFVAGSAVFKAEDAYAEIAELRRLANAHM